MPRQGMLLKVDLYGLKTCNINSVVNHVGNAEI